MKTRQMAAELRIESAVVEHWVEAGWLVPASGETDRNFSDVDLARAHLIRDLRSLGANDESIPIILDLVDQLHGVRRLLQHVLVTMKQG